jgi:hypothetical protein
VSGNTDIRCSLEIAEQPNNILSSQKWALLFIFGSSFYKNSQVFRGRAKIGHSMELARKVPYGESW